MSGGTRAPRIRQAAPADAPTVARLLRRFNAEYDEPAPPEPELARRVAFLLVEGLTSVLLADQAPADQPDQAPADQADQAPADDDEASRSGSDAAAVGVAVLRFRTALWTPGRECYLAELYVVPECRGEGWGRALLAAALDHARRNGADSMDLGTSEDDVAARTLYERFGFVNREHPPDGPLLYVYERDL